MRIWIQEKRRDISNHLQHQIDTNKLPDAPIDEVASYELQQEEKKAYLEDGEELITIPVKSNAEKQPNTSMSTQKADLSQGMSKEDIMNTEKEKVQEIISGLIQKAEFMIKLENIGSLNLFGSDSKSKNLSINTLTSNASLRKSVSVRRFESIREKQTSQETSKSFNGMGNKEMFSSCSALVLAILQSSMTVEEIQTTLEARYVNCIRRYLGFKMLNNLFNAYSPSKDRYLVGLRWLKHALKQNYDELCHYSDGITS